jgi:hypothetical protein
MKHYLDIFLVFIIHHFLDIDIFLVFLGQFQPPTTEQDAI